MINQEITDNWELACSAVEQYGDYLTAVTELTKALSGETENLIVADAVKGYTPSQATGTAKNQQYTSVGTYKIGGKTVKVSSSSGYQSIDYLKYLENKLGKQIKEDSAVKITGEMIKNMGGIGKIIGSGGTAVNSQSNNSTTYSPTINVTISGGTTIGANAKKFGNEVAEIAANNLYDAFSRRGIGTASTLRQ